MYYRTVKKYVLSICIVAAALLLYLPFVTNGYINVDDAGLIWNNSTVTQLDIPRAFSSYDPELYIPLTLLTYQIEYLISGAAPIVVHLTNVLLHALSALLVFFITKKLTRSTAIGLLTGLLFAVHPIQSTAVLWASARKDVLSSALMLLSLHLYLKENKWSIAAFAGALLSKISVVILPILLLLIDVWEGKPMNRDRIKEKWPYFGLSFLFGAIAIFGKTKNLSNLSAVDYLLLSAKNIVFSVQKIFVPTDLSFMYPQSTAVSVFAPDFYIPILLLIAVAGLLFILRKTQPVLLWCTAWFLICMAPNLLTYSQNRDIIFTSNRYVYLACIGVFLYISSLLVTQKRNVVLAGSIVLVGACSALTVAEARTWSSSETLMRSSLRAGYDHPIIHQYLAMSLRSKGQDDEALTEFMLAAQAGNPHSYKLAGDMQKERGNHDEAMRLYEQGMEAARVRGAYGSTDLAAHFEIAGIRLAQGRLQQAESILLEAKDLGDHIASVHINLGTLYLQTGNIARAKEHLITATKQNTFSAAAWYHLAFVYGQEGNLDKAETALKRVLRIDPNYEGAAENLQQIQNL
jgi:tetratricopeptide (TPR) repeat protein